MRDVVVVAFAGAQLVDVAGPVDVFDIANRLSGADEPYNVRVATPGGGTVRTGSGLRIVGDVALERVLRTDTLIVAGASTVEDLLGSGVLPRQVARLARTTRRTCSVCTGAFVLAEAGLLDGLPATTHWAGCRLLAEHYPRIDVQPDRIFVRNDGIYTSAGVTAGIDLSLALVEEDHGAALARECARWLVMFLQRPGGQSQFSARLDVPVASGSPIRPVLDAIVADPGADHRLPALAQRAALSERHLRRMFVEEAGTTPARFVERVRVEAARDLLEQSGTPVEAIAGRCGFGSAETMRRAFLRCVGVGPGEYRGRFRTAA